MQTKVNASDVSAARVVCTKHLKWLSQKEPQYTPCVSTPQEKSTKDFDLTLVSTFDEMASSPPAWLILVDTCF